MTHTFTNLLAKTLVPLAVISSIILGSFVLTNQAQAAASDAVIERTLPILASGAALAFSAITERAKPGALVNASVASEQKLAELMKLLEQLTAMYQALLKQKAALAPESSGATVDDNTTSLPTIKVVSPNGGETYRAGDKKQMPIQWKADCEFEFFSMYITREYDGEYGTYVINNSSPAGICKQGELNIPYYTTWPIPSDVRPGSYRLTVSGHRPGNPPTPNTVWNVIDSSDNYFKVVGEDTISTPVIDSFSINRYSEVINGTINVYNVTDPTVRWSSINTSYCAATSVEGISQTPTKDFTGTQPTSGSRQLMIGDSYFNQREITLTCYNEKGVASNNVVAWIGGKG